MSLFGIVDPAGDHTPEKSRRSVLGAELSAWDWPEAGLAAKIKTQQAKPNEHVRRYLRIIVFVSSWNSLPI